MARKHPSALSLGRSVYYTLLAALVLYLIVFTDLRSLERKSESYLDFSAGWLADGKTLVNIDEISAGDFGGRVVLEKKLPDTLESNVALCFLSNNAQIAVRIGTREVYAFLSRENLTGAGYGTAYHTVSLSPEDAGKVVTVELSSVFADHIGGRVGSPKICRGETYRHMFFRSHYVELMLSLLLAFSGLVILPVHALLALRRTAIAYKLPQLGLALILIGLWCTADTGAPQVMMGHLYAWRIVDYVALHLAVYPMVAFVNSLTRAKRRVFPLLALALSCGPIMLMLLFRFAFGLEMSRLSSILYCSYCLMIVLVLAVVLDNFLYCRRHGVSAGFRYFYAGSLCFVFSATLDLGLYHSLTSRQAIREHGVFLRVGLVLFVLSMLAQVFHWWFAERTTIHRDRFINRALQYAVSSADPEEGIRSMLAYLGAELHVERAYIFENRGDGTFALSYDWVREGVAPRAERDNTLPFEGLLDVLYHVFHRDHRFVVESSARYRELNPALYRILRDNRIERLAAGPLESGDDLLGFFGVDNPPDEIVDELAETIRLLSYFFSQLVLKRDEKKRLLRYSYYDSMTLCRNRRALEEFESRRLDTARPYGFLVCDVNGLKHINDTLGHEAGDAMILDAASCLTEVFGEEHVYRTGGDEFAAYSLGGSAEAFAADTARLRTLVEAKGRSVALGAVFRADGDGDLARVKREADELMYADKRGYYEKHQDRRRRQ